MEDTGAEIGPVEAAFASALYDHVVVIVWRGEPTRAVVERSGDAFHACARRADGPIAYLAVVEESSGPPRLSDLPFIAARLDAIESLQAIAVVLEGRDPWMPWALEAAAQITSAQRRRRPAKFCLETDEAIAWLVARRLHRAPDDVFRAGLSDTVARTRAQLDRW